MLSFTAHHGIVAVTCAGHVTVGASPDAACTR